MNWHSAAEFFAMGGYALYVWGSVAASALAVTIELIAVRARRRAALGLLREQLAEPELRYEESAA